MGSPISRIGDIGVGDDTCHSSTKKNVTGVLVTGAGTVRAEGSPVARIGSIVVRGDGHTGIVITGSGTVRAEGPGVGRVGDIFHGCFKGVLITGAGTVRAG